MKKHPYTHINTHSYADANADGNRNPETYTDTEVSPKSEVSSHASTAPVTCL